MELEKCGTLIGAVAGHQTEQRPFELEENRISMGMQSAFQAETELQGLGISFSWDLRQEGSEPL